ncbi:hypothetical protein ACCT09_47260, partial [Rhizobium ruizarguesonis]
MVVVGLMSNQQYYLQTLQMLGRENAGRNNQAQLHNSVELNARNIEIVGSTCLISASNIFKP